LVRYLLLYELFNVGDIKVKTWFGFLDCQNIEQEQTMLQYKVQEEWQLFDIKVYCYLNNLLTILSYVDGNHNNDGSVGGDCRLHNNLGFVAEISSPFTQEEAN